MKLRSKIAASFALLGAVSMAQAEAITFGVEIPPVASISVSNGLLVSAKAIASATPAAVTTLTAPFVGAFTVNTNMPKWNIYFSLANNGHLVDQSGNYLRSNQAGPGNVLGLGIAEGASTVAGNIWLKFPTTSDIKGDDGTAANIIVATPASFPLAADAWVDNTTHNTLTKVLNTTSGNSCTGAACADDGWIHASAPTTVTLGIGTTISSVNPVNAIAGTYTETMYLTLVTAY